MNIRGSSLRKAVALALAVVIAVVATSGSADAQKDDNQRFTLIFAGGFEQGAVAARGVVNGAGTVKVDRFDFNQAGEFEVETRYVFPNGTLFVRAQGQEDAFTLDERSCLGRYAGTGRFSVSSGTGDFEEARGEGESAFRGTFISERNPDGTCSQEDVLIEFEKVELSGNLRLEPSSSTERAA